MATIQQLEKLHHIQRLFYVEDSLEAAVAGERVGQIIARTEKLIRQRAFLRDERRRLRIATNAVDERQRSLKHMLRPDWVPKNLTEPRTPEENRRIRLNVGGLMFETPVYVLMKDPHSLMAQLCGPEPPISPDSADDCFYFDRDWWLFRYVLQFLRDGVLPEDRALLAQLYRESSFWQLTQMQRAIEEEKLHLRSDVTSTQPGEAWKVDATVAAATGADAMTGKPTGVTPHDVASYKELKQNEAAIWWKKLPSWWQAVDEQQQRAVVTKVEQAASQKQDWWTDTVYKGRVYLPTSEAAEPQPLIPPHNITRSTWAAFGDNNRKDPYGYSGGYQGGNGYGYGGFGVATINGGAVAGHQYPHDHHHHPDHPPLQPFLANAGKGLGGPEYGSGFSS